jgi:hypothetical protein
VLLLDLKHDGELRKAESLLVCRFRSRRAAVVAGVVVGADVFVGVGVGAGTGGGSVGVHVGGAGSIGGFEAHGIILGKTASVGCLHFKLVALCRLMHKGAAIPFPAFADCVEFANDVGKP